MPDDTNAQCRRFLAAYAAGGTVEGGWFHAQALQQCRLDFSDESLARLDRFLAAVRERAPPTRASLQDSEPGRNGCALLAFYLIEIVRRRTGATIDWHDRTSAAATLPRDVALPDFHAARLVALAPASGAAFYPIGWVIDQLLGTGKAGAAAEYVAGIVAQVERHGPVAWHEGMQALGMLASWQMMAAAAGHPVWPTSLSSTAPRNFNQWRGTSEGVSAGLQAAVRLLELNPEGASWQVLAYDGLLGEGEDKQDAVMVVLEAYGEKPLRVKFAFPYRPAGEGRPLLIRQPAVLMGCNVDAALIQALYDDVQRGIEAVKWPDGESWGQYLERPAAPAVAPASEGAGRHHVPPQPDEPEPAALLERLRASLGQWRQRAGERQLARLVVAKPPRLDPADPLAAVFGQQELLLTKGRVAWGAIVQANQQLYKPGTADLPAMLVHSGDAYFDAHPSELRLLGSRVFALKGTQPEDPELASLARIITGETERVSGLRLPPVFTSRELLSSVSWVFRSHLPTGVLSCGLLPILVHPDVRALMVVPCEFWPPGLTVLWRDGKL